MASETMTTEIKRGRGRPKMVKQEPTASTFTDSIPEPSKPVLSVLPILPIPIESIKIPDKDKLDTLKSLVMSQQLKLIELEDKQKKICLTITNFIGLLRSQFKGVFERFIVSW